MIQADQHNRNKHFSNWEEGWLVLVDENTSFKSKYGQKFGKQFWVHQEQAGAELG